MFVTRFAPSPTGYLHLGHAFSALKAFDAARNAGGRFLLRIEDTDLTRCKPEFTVAIFEDLDWLGIAWELPVLHQSEHMDVYAQARSQLENLGVLYRCFRTRSEVLADIANAPHQKGEVFKGAALEPHEEEKLLAEGKPFAWRLSLDKCQKLLGSQWHDLSCMCDGETIRIDPSRLGDVVLARKEFPTSYHLASVIDDDRQGVSHVIRGIDLIDAPHIHVLLQTLLELRTPIYHHHRLIVDAEGKRLAKRDQSVTLRALRTSGATPQSVRAQLGLLV
jgi:glutamyl-Q tRNA(Asp) synthetase